MAHGWNAQWKKEYSIATWAPALVLASANPNGGAPMWERGSATPKNMRPMPMPALNIIATHETVLNSGCSSWAPSRILPNRLKARYSAKDRKPKVESMNIQPKLGTRKLHKTASKTAARLLVKKIPHATNTAERTAATQNTVRSMLGPSEFCSTGLLPVLPFGRPDSKHTLT